MMNLLACIGLKQRRIAIGGGILAIAITACNAPNTSQISSANTPPSTPTPSVASSSGLPSPSSTQNIASPSPSFTPAKQQDTAETLQQKAVQVIRNYYNAIAHRNYQQAYSAWDENGAASKQSFEQFRQGFANTASVAVEVGEPGRVDGAAGSSYIEIPVTITAITTNGDRQHFRGSYILRRVDDVPGSTAEQRRWHLYSANITPVN